MYITEQDIRGMVKKAIHCIMDDWYKKRGPKNYKKKKFGYGADYVSEEKNKLTNR